MVCKEYKNLKGGLILCIIRPRKHKKKYEKTRENTSCIYLLYKGVKVKIELMVGTNDKAEAIKYNFFIYYR